jgi:hypothetical protein
MFAIIAFFLDGSEAKTALANLAETLSESPVGPREFYAVLRQILEEGLYLKPAIFAEKNVVACDFYGFDTKESALAEAALLGAGALEVIVE